MAVCLFLAGAAAAQPVVTVTHPAGFAVSPNVKDLPDDNEQRPAFQHPHHPLPSRGAGNSGDDSALQKTGGDDVKAQRNPQFPGLGANGSAPGDPNIAVGPNHIVETVNTQYAVFNHSGTLLVGPKTLSSLWTPLGGSCAVQNAGDPIVQYDRTADRWLISQLGSQASPFSECIAISQTNDPGGAFNLYSFTFGNQLNDYPKFGVWPTATNSAYLATYNLFAGGATFTGAGLCAYDRTAMLAGSPGATSICFTVSNDGGFLPSDVDGPTPPLDGTPGYFLNFETLGSLRMYRIAPNFATPTSSTLTPVAPDLTVSTFSEACGGGTCIPQSGTNTQLDSLGDRLMYRLSFRMFPDHEALVVNHSVAAGATVGVRWYELRAPVSAAAAFTVFQQGTFAPDATFRWMGSAATDQAGDIAIGYSASSSAIHPAIRFTGRLPGDALGTMRAEASLLEGTGSQTGGLTRWGDYSALRIDPLDDCTFWYTNQFLSANGSFNWSTFIGSFRLAGCGTPDFTISASPASQTVTVGSSASYTVTVGALGGFTGTVQLSTGALPAGTTATFTPATVTGSGSATLTVTTSGTTPTGSSPLTITGTGGSLVHSTNVTLVVNPVPVPDFSLTASPGSRTVAPSGTTTYTATVTALNGFTGTVALSVSGLPSGATGSFSAPTVTGSGSSTLTVTTASTPVGSYTLTITGTSGALSHAATVTLVVSVAPSPDFSLSVTPTSRSVTQGSSVRYTVTVTPSGGFTSPVTFSVTGLPAQASASFSVNPVVGSGSTSMRVRAGSGTPVGTYTLTITGTSGTLLHSLNVSLTVTVGGN